MKKLFAIIVILICFGFTTNAQDLSKTKATKKLSISKLKVEAPNGEDSIFLASAVREALLRNGSITIDAKGDVLNVKLFTQWKKENGAGETVLILISDKGDAASTSRIYIENNCFYFKSLKTLVEQVTTSFVYQQ